MLDKLTFYKSRTVIKVEWWISYVCEFPEPYWGRLRVFSDGTADAALEESKVYGFDDQRYAGYFLSEDEYTRLEGIDEEDAKNIGINPSEISPPLWENEDFSFEYLGLMVSRKSLRLDSWCYFAFEFTNGFKHQTQNSSSFSNYFGAH